MDQLKLNSDFVFVSLNANT